MLTLCRIILAKEDDDDDKPSGLCDTFGIVILFKKGENNKRVYDTRLE